MTKNPVDLISIGFDSIPSMASRLIRGTDEYLFYESVFRESFLKSDFAHGERETFGPFGEIIFPFVRMGAVSSLDLFGLDELILFAFYRESRSRYSRFADLGANLGLHSLIAGKLGWGVTAFEPDPHTFSLLEKNLCVNSTDAEAVCKAVGANGGARVFTRVLGNLTGSHLSGSKENPYGELEEFTVEVESLRKIMSQHDFLKIDVEGAEAEIIGSTAKDDWVGTDAVLEIGSPTNARVIFDHLRSLGGVNMFSQKTGWQLVEEVADLPVSHLEGSVFVSSGAEGPFASREATR